MRLALLALLAAPALADERPFDPAPVTECEAAGGRHDCIGLAARACWQEDNSTPLIGLCLADELRFWEDRREAARAGLKDGNIAWDMGQREHDFPSNAYEAGLAAEAAFGAYADARCGYVVEMWGPGSGQGPALAECRMRVTAEHVLWLEDWLERN